MTLIEALENIAVSPKRKFTLALEPNTQKPGGLEEKYIIDYVNFWPLFPRGATKKSELNVRFF